MIVNQQTYSFRLFSISNDFQINALIQVETILSPKRCIKSYQIALKYHYYPY